MTQTHDWQQNREMWVRILEERTGEGVVLWVRRIKEEGQIDESVLRAWLTTQGVTGYAQSLLMMERFGYPDFFLATADELIDDKIYVSLVTPRKTFARLQPTTRNRVDLGLRLEGQQPVGHLHPSKLHETMRLQISLISLEEEDSEVLGWLERAYNENCCIKHPKILSVHGNLSDISSTAARLQLGPGNDHAFHFLDCSRPRRGAKQAWSITYMLFWRWCRWPLSFVIAFITVVIRSPGCARRHPGDDSLHTVDDV